MKVMISLPKSFLADLDELVSDLDMTRSDAIYDMILYVFKNLDDFKATIEGEGEEEEPEEAEEETEEEEEEESEEGE